MFRSLFPTNGVFLIFITYVAIFVGVTILVTASKDAQGKYPYNTVTVVLLIEFTKLLVAIVYNVKELGFGGTISEVRKNSKIFILYFVPAGIYCIYNNLAYACMRIYDPATYLMLLQMRIALTGVIFQILFQQKLNKNQWLAIFLLTAGVVVKQVNFSEVGVTSIFQFGLLLMIIQASCSSFAGVYNEYLLKGKMGDVPVMVQNIFMYSDSIVCNSAILLYNGELSTALSGDNLAAILNWNILVLIATSAAGGIVTSLFLKNLNSIIKTFANAIEIISAAIFTWLLFGIPLTVQTFIAMGMVIGALYLYSVKPETPSPTPKA